MCICISRHYWDGGGFPPSGNFMAFLLSQVWDERLARSAEAWASQCIWAHGPSQLMRYVGQNLSVHSGRWVSPPFTPSLHYPSSTPSLNSSLSTQSEFLPSPPPSQVPLGGGSCEVLVRGEAALLVSCPKGLYPALPLALPWPCLLPLYPGTLCRAEGLVGEIECGGQQPVRTSFYIMSLFLYIHWTELNWILYWVS